MRERERERDRQEAPDSKGLHTTRKICGLRFARPRAAAAAVGESQTEDTSESFPRRTKRRENRLKLCATTRGGPAPRKQPCHRWSCSSCLNLPLRGREGKKLLRTWKREAVSVGGWMCRSANQVARGEAGANHPFRVFPGGALQPCSSLSSFVIELCCSARMWVGMHARRPENAAAPPKHEEDGGRCRVVPSLLQY